MKKNTKIKANSARLPSCNLGGAAEVWCIIIPNQSAIKDQASALHTYPSRKAQPEIQDKYMKLQLNVLITPLPLYSTVE